MLIDNCVAPLEKRLARPQFLSRPFRAFGASTLNPSRTSRSFYTGCSAHLFPCKYVHMLIIVSVCVRSRARTCVTKFHLATKQSGSERFLHWYAEPGSYIAHLELVREIKSPRDYSRRSEENSKFGKKEKNAIYQIKKDERIGINDKYGEEEKCGTEKTQETEEMIGKDGTQQESRRWRSRRRKRGWRRRRGGWK